MGVPRNVPPTKYFSGVGSGRGNLGIQQSGLSLFTPRSKALRGQALHFLVLT